MDDNDLTVNADQFGSSKWEEITAEYQSINAVDNMIYHESNYIHPTAIVGANVKMGKGNFIGAYCIIRGNTIIGNNNKFYSQLSIGSAPEHKEHWNDEKNKGVIIGDNCMFREFVTVNAGFEHPTIIEDDVIMLRGSHIGHDSRIMRNATISCNVLIGGHSLVGIFANMGLGSVCHQHSRIPHYCMVGMNSTITKKISKMMVAFHTYVGSPAKLLGRNNYWNEAFTEKDIERITYEFINENLAC